VLEIVFLSCLWLSDEYVLEEDNPHSWPVPQLERTRDSLRGSYASKGYRMAQRARLSQVG
jgi:hypothetical protein